MNNLAGIFETFMIVLFGLSWPVNISKAWKARSAKGISVLFFYVLNTLMVTAGILIYFRSRRLDKMK